MIVMQINTCINKMPSDPQESCILAAIRDVLPPKLISREIRVNVPEKELGETA